jgi:3,2-trans-enoyl-CoA isomerase
MLDVTDHPIEVDAPPGVGGIRELRLARPPVNALNAELLRRIGEAVQGAATASAIVITGQPGVFSAGLDVRAMLELDRDGVAAVFVELWRVSRALARSPVPVLFGLTGHSPAGGTVLAIHGDYRILASGDFRMGLNEVQVGLFPGPPIHGAFHRLVGGHSAQLLTRGALVDPATALAREICALPREPMLKTRELVRRDLVSLFGDPSHSMHAEREFAAMAVDRWLIPSTQARLRQMFAKR